MRSILGKIILAPAVLAAVALASATPMSASTVNIPFSFAAAGHVWPAGQYSVQKDTTGDLVTVRNFDTSLSFTSLLGPGEPAPTDSRVVLQFDQFGATHALRTIQFGPQITSRLDGKMAKSEYLRASGR